MKNAMNEYDSSAPRWVKAEGFEAMLKSKYEWRLSSNKKAHHTLWRCEDKHMTYAFLDLTHLTVKSSVAGVVHPGGGLKGLETLMEDTRFLSRLGAIGSYITGQCWYNPENDISFHLLHPADDMCRYSDCKICGGTKKEFRTEQMDKLMDIVGKKLKFPKCLNEVTAMEEEKRAKESEEQRTRMLASRASKNEEEGTPAKRLTPDERARRKGSGNLGSHGQQNPEQ